MNGAQMLRRVKIDASEATTGVSAATFGPAVTPLPAPQGALTFEELAGTDPQMLRVVRSAQRVVDCPVSVLIQGPTGSGKEALAYAMHRASRRAHRPFVALNCAALPESLIESELFGYRAGAFTGARREGLRGRIVQSSGGTLFLDEIGDMPLALQSRLLRVLEEQAVIALGSDTATPIELHVIAASNRNVLELIGRQAFREDLYYRLNGITLELPALRDRADKERLVQRMLDLESSSERPAALDQQALRCLLTHNWPGNIRELRNVMRAALAICDCGIVRPADLPEALRGAAATLPARPSESPAAESALTRAGHLAAPRGRRESNPRKAAERAALLKAIEDSRGNMSEVAARLEISRNTLYRRMRRHGITLTYGAALRAAGEDRHYDTSELLEPEMTAGSHDAPAHA